MRRGKEEEEGEEYEKEEEEEKIKENERNLADSRFPWVLRVKRSPWGVKDREVDEEGGGGGGELERREGRGGGGRGDGGAVGVNERVAEIPILAARRRLVVHFC